MYKIFIIEDDKVISKEIETQLKNWEFDAKGVENFNNVIEELRDFSPHLVIMDIKLPYLNGFLICEKIREFSKIPVIFISSAGDNMNLIMAINYGADDFIAKPFEMEILVAKIKALLRRSYDYESEKMLEYEDLVLLPEKSIIKIGQDKNEISKNECKILEILLENRGKIVSREDIMIKLWDTESFIDDNTLTVNVNRLRTRLKEMGKDNIIKTKKGMGYYI